MKPWLVSSLLFFFFHFALRLLKRFRLKKIECPCGHHVLGPDDQGEWHDEGLVGHDGET